MFNPHFTPPSLVKSSAGIITAWSRARIVFAAIACAFSATTVAAVDYPRQECLNFFHQVDKTVWNADAYDAQAYPIKGYSYLRANRFLASFKNELSDETKLSYWLTQLHKLDHDARRIEWQNLPSFDRTKLDQLRLKLFPASLDTLATLDQCAGELIAQAREQPKQIIQNVTAPASYSILKRLAGLYPFTAVPFSSGIRRHQAKISASYAQALAQVIATDKVIKYVPPSSQADNHEIETLIKKASDNPLNIPDPNAEQLQLLFAKFAPIFAQETKGNFDRLGRPEWQSSNRAVINIAQPTVHTLHSHARMNGKILLQLNYVIWFTERPKSGAFDMLGGAVDSVIWRVTLTPEGQPLAYDTIHGCGCYHYFFPSDTLRAKPRHPSLQEYAYAPQAAPVLGPGERVVVWLESATHYITRVTRATPADEIGANNYLLAEYDELRSLAKSDGTTRNLFRPDGLIHGTERGERLLFWPMGIASAGAMRQWGHHATAFVGMRHFDDPDLFESAFELAK